MSVPLLHRKCNRIDYIYRSSYKPQVAFFRLHPLISLVSMMVKPFADSISAPGILVSDFSLRP
jgi:hypothetical protein